MSYESHTYYNGNLYASNAKDVKNRQLFMHLHADITKDVKNPTTITRPNVGITMVVKKPNNYYKT
jgi:hypothetical protein